VALSGALVERQVEIEHVDGRLAQEAERAAVLGLPDQVADLAGVEAARPGDAVDL
jgi:hypothetical protein